MIELKDAYEILGVKEGASRDEIVKRYDILLKKHRMNQQQGQNDEADLEKLNEAYNLLMGYHSKELDDAVEAERKRMTNPLLKPIAKKFNLDEKKVYNFFYYHKVHIIVSLIVLVAMVYTVRSCANRVEPDINVEFIGDFLYSETDVLKEMVRSRVPDIKEPSIDIITISDKIQGEQDYAMRMKAVTLMAAGDIDIFILDKANFNLYAKQGAFLSLDDLADELNIDRDKNKDYIAKVESSQEEHLFGVDISNSSILKEANMKYTEAIATMRFNPKHRDLKTFQRAYEMT